MVFINLDSHHQLLNLGRVPEGSRVLGGVGLSPFATDPGGMYTPSSAAVRCLSQQCFCTRVLVRHCCSS